MAACSTTATRPTNSPLADTSPKEFWSEEDHPNEQLGIRRHWDRCFHAVEEEVEEGYIVQGTLIPREDVAEVRRTPKSAPPACVQPPKS